MSQINKQTSKTLIQVSKLIGLPKKKAISEIKKSGFKSRIVREDTESFVGTCDFRTDRINIEIDKNIVTSATIG